MKEKETLIFLPIFLVFFLFLNFALADDSKSCIDQARKEGMIIGKGTRFFKWNWNRIKDQSNNLTPACRRIVMAEGTKDAIAYNDYLKRKEDQICSDAGSNRGYIGPNAISDCKNLIEQDKEFIENVLKNEFLKALVDNERGDGCFASLDALKGSSADLLDIILDLDSFLSTTPGVVPGFPSAPGVATTTTAVVASPKAITKPAPVGPPALVGLPAKTDQQIPLDDLIKKAVALRVHTSILQSEVAEYKGYIASLKPSHPIETIKLIWDKSHPKPEEQSKSMDAKITQIDENLDEIEVTYKKMLEDGHDRVITASANREELARFYSKEIDRVTGIGDKNTLLGHLRRFGFRGLSLFLPDSYSSTEESKGERTRDSVRTSSEENLTNIQRELFVLSEAVKRNININQVESNINSDRTILDGLNGNIKKLYILHASRKEITDANVDILYSELNLYDPKKQDKIVKEILKIDDPARRRDKLNEFHLAYIRELEASAREIASHIKRNEKIKEIYNRSMDES